MTFTTEAGERRHYQLGEGGPKLDQIRVGDTVKATLAEPVAFTIRKSSAPPDAIATVGAVIVERRRIGALCELTRLTDEQFARGDRENV